MLGGTRGCGGVGGGGGKKLRRCFGGFLAADTAAGFERLDVFLALGYEGQIGRLDASETNNIDHSTPDNFIFKINCI